ncbi:LysR family transcriptional regulator [Alkalihalobacillus sp. FSL R5-0424]
MNIEQLMYIVEVAKEKSLGAAAKTLNVSQSALSQAITKLECELDVKIFTRSRAGAVPTKEGDLIIARSHEALEAIHQIKEEAQQLKDFNTVLRMNVIPGLIGPIVDSYLKFKEDTPSFKIEISERSSMDIIHEIKNDKIDIGFIAVRSSNMEVVNGFHFTPVTTGKLLVFASKNSAIAKTDRPLNPSLLQEQLFVLYKDEYVQSFISSFHRLYGPINIFLETTDLHVITNTILQHGAITIGHDISAKYSKSFPYEQEMIALDIEQFFDSSFTFGWISKYDHKLSGNASEFINEVSEQVKR